MKGLCSNIKVSFRSSLVKTIKHIVDWMYCIKKKNAHRTSFTGKLQIDLLFENMAWVFDRIAVSTPFVNLMYGYIPTCILLSTKIFVPKQKKKVYDSDNIFCKNTIYIFKKCIYWSGVVLAFNSRTWEADGGEVQGQSGLYCKFQISQRYKVRGSLKK